MLTRLLRVRPYEVELLRPMRRAPPLAWLLFAAGLAALTAATLTCRPEWNRQGELAGQRAQLETALARLGVEPLVRADRVGRDANAHDGARASLDEAVALVNELHRPWHELFDQLEKAQDSSVHLVQLSVEPRFTTVQLIAEGRDLSKLVRFSQRLSGGAQETAGPIRTMAMTHQEWRDALGAHVVSASMQGELTGALRSAAPAGAAQ